MNDQIEYEWLSLFKYIICMYINTNFSPFNN
jgi:hypothetical protein